MAFTSVPAGAGLADPGLLPVTNLREPHLVEPGQHMPGVGPADLSALGDRAA
jgi:hypothetical protein